jgi:UDPglucose--hexose-1-phosphate uridylyltransferase
VKGNELRLDPLRQTWTLFAPERIGSPLFGPRARPGGPSPFSSGREALAPHTLYQAAAEPTGLSDDWRVRVVANRVPVVRVEGSAHTLADGFYDHMDGVGAHEVIIETPGPEEFEALSLTAAAAVVQAWQVRMLDLARDARMRSFFIVKDAGAPAGGNLAHAVSQFIALAMVPPALKQKLAVARDFFDRHKRSIFEDIMAEELRAGRRIVYENSGMLVFCPYASRAPFELAILPKRQHADFQTISREEAAQLADALQSALRRLNAALTFPAYNLALSTAPARTPRGDYWHTIDQDFRWHVELLPRLFPSTSIDLATGCSVNPVLPETAAACLRETLV